MDNQLLGHVRHTNKGKSKEIVRYPGDSPGQNSVFNDPSWLDQILDAEEEELEELAATLSSGTAYYASTPGSSSSSQGSKYYSLPEGSSVNSTTSAPPAAFDHDVVSDPDSIVRIIKPLPKRHLKSRFPSAVRVIKPLPKKSLRSHFPSAIRVIKPLPMPKAPSLSDPGAQSSSISMDVDNQTSFPNQPDNDATMEYQPSWQQEADDYAMDEDESHRLSTSIVFRDLKDGSADQLTAMSTYPVEEPMVYGSLFEQVDPWNTTGQISGLSSTEPSKSLGEMIEELDKLDDSEEWLRIRSAIAANTIRTNDALPTGTGQHQHGFQPGYSGMQDTVADNHHQKSSSPLLGSPSLELDDNESEFSDDSIPSGQVLPDIFSQFLADTGMDSTNKSLQTVNFDNESLDEVQIGDGIERDTSIHYTAVPTVNDSTSLTEPSRSTSVSIFEPSLSAPGHGPTSSPNGQEGSTSASDPKSLESSPANSTGPTNKRKRTTADSNTKRLDSESVDNSSSSNEPAQSMFTTSSVPATIVTRYASRSPSPPIHTSFASSSGQFLSALARPRSPALPSMLQPAVPNNSDVPAQADVILMCPAPYTGVSSTIDIHPLGAITPNAITAPQPQTFHLLGAFDQDKPHWMPPNYVTFDTQNMSFESLAPVAGICIPYTPLSSLYFPDYHTPIAPEMWWWPDMQLDPNGVGDPMDLEDFDEPMTSWSDLYGQSYQAHPETAFAMDWHHTEATEDVEMENAILAERRVAHDDSPSTPMNYLVIMEDLVPYVGEEREPTALPNNAIDSSSESPVDPPMPAIALAAPDTTETQSLTAETPCYQTPSKVHKTQQGEVTEPVITQPPTIKFRNVPTSTTIPPLHPELLIGDMSAFTHQISTTVNALDSLTSLKLEAPHFAAIQNPATQLVSAANRQPMAHGGILQSPEPKTPTDKPPTAANSADALDRDERSVGRNSVKKEVTQPEDIDTNAYPTPLPDYGEAVSNEPGRSTSNRSLTRYGWRSMVNNTPSTILPSNGGGMQTPDLEESAIKPLFSDTASERDFTRTATVSSKSQNKEFNRSTTEISPSRTRRRVRLFVVDIANTRLAFETETSEPRFQSSESVSSTALHVEVSSHMGSIPKNVIPTALQLDKSVETLNFWDSLWGALTSLLWEDSPLDM